MSKRPPDRGAEADAPRDDIIVGRHPTPGAHPAMLKRESCPVCDSRESKFLVKLNRNYLVDSKSGRRYEPQVMRNAGLDFDRNPDAGCSYLECSSCGTFYLRELFAMEAALGDSRCRQAGPGDAPQQHCATGGVSGRLSRADELAGMMSLALASTNDDRLKILDYGCGDGSDLAIMRSLGTDVVGFDIVESRLEMLRASLASDVTLVSDQSLLAEHGPFDAVRCNQVLEHVFEPKQAVDLIRSLLKPGGVAHFGIPSATKRAMARNVGLVERGENVSYLHPGHVQIWNWDSLPPSTYVKSRGFEIIPVRNRLPTRDASGLRGLGSSVIDLLVHEMGAAMAAVALRFGRYRANGFFARKVEG